MFMSAFQPYAVQYWGEFLHDMTVAYVCVCVRTKELAAGAIYGSDGVDYRQRTRILSLEWECAQWSRARQTEQQRDETRRLNNCARHLCICISTTAAGIQTGSILFCVLIICMHVAQCVFT